MSSLVDRNREMYGHGESRRAHALQPSKVVWTRHVCEWAAAFLRHGDRVLEIGGGGGYKASKVSDMVDVRWIGLDVSSSSLRERFEDSRLRANVQASMDVLPFGDGSFDAVVFFGALHHSEQPAATLREVRRVLRPGGRLLLQEPNSLAVRLRGTGMEPANDIEFRFSLPFLLAQLKMAGFRVVRVTTAVIASRFLARLPLGQSLPVMRAGEWLDRRLLMRLPLVSRLGAGALITAELSPEPRV